jgi:hypothetical protein
MNPLIQLKHTTSVFLLAFALVCFVLLPKAPAAPETALRGFNTADGDHALAGVTTGIANTAVGWHSLGGDTSGSSNSGFGAGTLVLNNGDQNTAVGTLALFLNTTGLQNTAVGNGALLHNDTGEDNNALGAFALFSNVGGFFNNAVGRNSLMVSDGDQNNVMGDDAMFSNTTGSFNTAVGDDALNACIDGNSNIAIGDEAGTGIVHGSNIIMIGVSDVSSAFGESDNTCYINNIFGEPVGVGPGQAVFVDQDGVLGFTTSSRRYKHDIKPMDKASEALFALKPVTFKYNSDKQGMTCFGLIAEDVAEVNHDLVLRDKKGEVSSVRYEQINAMLLNEFLKEHRRNEQQEATIARQQKQIDALTAGLQKVRAQLDLSKLAPQTVLNNQ